VTWIFPLHDPVVICIPAVGKQHGPYDPIFVKFLSCSGHLQPETLVATWNIVTLGSWHSHLTIGLCPPGECPSGDLLSTGRGIHVTL
jgi:hypothetical protein